MKFENEATAQEKNLKSEKREEFSELIKKLTSMASNCDKEASNKILEIISNQSNQAPIILFMPISVNISSPSERPFEKKRSDFSKPGGFKKRFSKPERFFDSDRQGRRGPSNFKRQNPFEENLSSYRKNRRFKKENNKFGSEEKAWSEPISKY